MKSGTAARGGREKEPDREIALGESVHLRCLLRCDGSPTLGLGHVARGLALARELRERHGVETIFAMRSGPLAFAQVREAGFEVQAAPRVGFNYRAWLERLCRGTGAALLAADVRDELDAGTLLGLRARGVKVALIDDLSPRRLAADWVFLPPVPQAQGLDWSGCVGRVLIGWEWVVLRREFSRDYPQAEGGIQTGVINGLSTGNTRARVLVTMGGSDPAGLTLKALDAIELLDGELDAAIVIGRGFMQTAALMERLRGARRGYRVFRDAEKMAELMRGSTLAVASFGVTAYELAALGIPAIFLCLSADHSRSASLFAREGMALNLGEQAGVGAVELAAALRRLLADPGLLKGMAQRARRKVDGRGVERIAAEMVGAANSGESC